MEFDLTISHELRHENPSLAAKYFTQGVKYVIFEWLKVLTSYNFYTTYVLYYYYINNPVKQIR